LRGPSPLELLVGILPKGEEEVQILDINKLIEFDDQKFNPKVLVNEPQMRIVLLCLRAGQEVPEHQTSGPVNAQAISGRVTFYDGAEPCEMTAGMLVRIEAGRPHRVVSHQDSALLVTLVKNPGTAVSQAVEPGTSVTVSELDLRDTPRPQRHPLVFTAFDRLEEGESFVLINDHDPQPLRRQMERTREAEVGWEYIERGPEFFRIRITRVRQPVR
jgi:uncharacterized protein (DUF2249 family)/quercetin dioxygenase-like cupin family protein